jgi:hypothetical protein
VGPARIPNSAEGIAGRFGHSVRFQPFDPADEWFD